MSIRLNQALIPVLATMVLLGNTMRAQQTNASTALAGAHTAMIGSSASLQDITLTGDVDHTVGSTSEHGTITMIAHADGSARFDIALPKGTFSSSVFVQDSRIQGQRKNAAGEVHTTAAHNAMVDAAWFWPAFLVQRYEAAAKLGEVSDGATVNHNGQSAVHLTSALEAKTGHEPTDKEIRRLSRTSLFLDPASFQPVAFAYETHPEHNSLLNISAEVRYSEYKTVDGIAVPMHIQRYMNGVLDLDIHLTSAQVNTGLPTSKFHF